jgi:5-methylcytosine-specific restriction enzyme A
MPTDNRKSSAKRGYGSRWQKYRERYLKANPICVMHDKRGITVAATVVDHIQQHKLSDALESGDAERIKAATKLFWDPKNHQALCDNCHDSHKKRFEMSGRVIGCDVNGVPIDANHHWNV